MVAHRRVARLSASAGLVELGDPMEIGKKQLISILGLGEGDLGKAESPMHQLVLGEPVQQLQEVVGQDEGRLLGDLPIHEFQDLFERRT